MDTVLHHRIFKTSTSAIADIAEPTIASNTNPANSVPYTEIMLGEYCHLVNSLATLNNSQLQVIQADVNKVLNKLTKWLDKAGSVNAIELLSSIRHLKQKAGGLATQITQKPSIINSKSSDSTTLV